MHSYVVRDTSVEAKDLLIKDKYVKPIASCYKIRAKEIHC